MVSHADIGHACIKYTRPRVLYHVLCTYDYEPQSLVPGHDGTIVQYGGMNTERQRLGEKN